MMEWYPIKTADRLGLEWLKIDPATRAHYHSLEMYCAWRENSGVIKNARKFSKRDWDRVGSIPKNSINRMEAVGLVHWNGENLVLPGYDVAQQVRAQRRKQQQSNAGSAKKGRKPEAKVAELNENDLSAVESVDLSAVESVDCRKEKEEKEREIDLSVASATADLFGHEATPKKPKKKPPLPYTIAQVAKTLAAESGGLFNPDMPDKGLAKPITDAIRRLGESGVTLDDIAAAGRWVAGGGTGGHEVGMLWLAGIGKLGNAVAQARKSSSNKSADGSPQLVSPDGEVVTEVYS